MSQSPSQEDFDRFIFHLVISLFAEGMGIRPMERALAPLRVSRSALARIGLMVGESCASLLDARVRNLKCRTLQLDEMHAFIGSRESSILDDDRLDWEGQLETPEDPANYRGQAWTYLALDPETKLIVSYHIGRHDLKNNIIFLKDIKGRVANTPIIATDGWQQYRTGIDQVFGRNNVHYGIIVKLTERMQTRGGKFKDVIVGHDRKIIFGNPPRADISTSMVERVNREVRSHLRRNTRRTPAHSKRLKNHIAAMSLFIAYYNFCLCHRSLQGMTPAMAAGLEKEPWTIGDLIGKAGATNLHAQRV